VPRKLRAREKDRIQLLHTYIHLSVGIIDDYQRIFETHELPFENPVIRASFLKYLDRGLGYCDGIDLAGYTLEGNHAHFLPITDPTPTPLEEAARLHLAYRDEKLDPNSLVDAEKLTTICDRMHDYSYFMQLVAGPFAQWFKDLLEKKKGAKIYTPVWTGRFGCTHLLSAKAALQGLVYVELNPLRRRPEDDPIDLVCEDWDGMWQSKAERCAKGFSRLVEVINEGRKVEGGEEEFLALVRETIARNLAETRRRARELREAGIEHTSPSCSRMDLTDPAGCPAFRRGHAIGEFGQIQDFSRRHWGQEVTYDRACHAVDDSDLCALVKPRFRGAERRC
jgi:hypothetical protein